MKSVVALNYTKYVPSHWEGVVSRPDLTTRDGGNKLQLQTLLTFYNRSDWGWMSYNVKLQEPLG